MRIDDFDYELPADRIAQHPAERRDASRLLVLDRGTGAWTDTRFDAIGEVPPGTRKARRDGPEIRESTGSTGPMVGSSSRDSAKK